MIVSSGLLTGQERNQRRFYIASMILTIAAIPIKDERFEYLSDRGRKYCTHRMIRCLNIGDLVAEGISGLFGVKSYIETVRKKNLVTY